MSLKIFHMIFIVAAVALSLMLAGWGVRQFLNEQRWSSLALGLVSLAAAVALIVYGIRAWPKYRELR